MKKLKEKSEKEEIGKKEETETPQDDKTIEKEIDDNLEKEKLEKELKEQGEKAFNLDSTIDEIEKETPEISEHVFEANKEEFGSPEQLNNDSSPIIEVYDPSIHTSGKEGKGTMKKDGTFRKKKGVSTSNLGKIPELSNEEKERLVIDEQNKTVALVSTLTADRIRQYLGAIEATQSEKDYLEKSIAIWLHESNIIVNPNVGLVMAISTFFLPVVFLPKEDNKIYQFFGKLFKKKELIEND